MRSNRNGRRGWMKWLVALAVIGGSATTATAQAGGGGPLPDAKVFRSTDGEHWNAGQATENTRLLVYNASPQSQLRVQWFDPAVGRWQEHILRPGERFVTNIGKFTRVQLADIPDHQDCKGLYAFKGAKAK